MKREKGMESGSGSRLEIHLPQVVGGGFGEFWRCRKRYRVVKGGKGSKKSSTAALWFIYNLMKIPLSNLLVVRKYYNSHYTSTFSQLRWAISRLGVSHLWRVKLTPLEITYIPTGQQIIFRGLDDAERLASVTVNDGFLCWVWLEEAFEIDREADFDKLDFSVPRGEVPKEIFKQTTLTLNPWNERHFIKKRFFDSEDENVFSMNATYLQNEFLDHEDLALFERLRRDNYRKYSVIGLGEWGGADGLVFENFRVEEFDVDEVLKIESVRCVYGLDYGYTSDPTAFVALAVEQKLGQTGKIYLFDEHYERRMLNSKIAEMIISKGFSKERIYADSSDPKSNEELRRLGISRLKSVRKGAGSILAGIMKLYEFEIIIHPRCVDAVREFSSYIWDSDSAETPKAGDDHIIDAVRYAMEDVSLIGSDLRRMGRRFLRDANGDSTGRKKVQVRQLF